MERSAAEQRVRRLADEICIKKHRDYHDSLICVGPGSGRGFSPPCDECIQEARTKLKRRQKAKSQKNKDGN
jgi:hypothetical protein